MARICVFCGSSPGLSPAYSETAAEVGRRIAEGGDGLVYGGGSRGLMGALADAALAAGGHVVGVIPEALAKGEAAHDRLTKLHVVPSMHARKALMAEISDAFLVLPGGLGTLDELFEIVTWAQLGVHDKPIGLLNVSGYFEPLVRLIDHVIREGFVPEESRRLLLISDSPEDLLQDMRRVPPRLARTT